MPPPGRPQASSNHLSNLEILFIVLQTSFIQYQTNTVLSKFTSQTNLDEEYKGYNDEEDNTNDVQVKEVEKKE